MNIGSEFYTQGFSDRGPSKYPNGNRKSNQASFQAIELDVHLTKDNLLVVIHDHQFSRFIELLE
ncbi:glycerophosphodiester phosphodiesterase family protein [Gracilibacillus xinjiangensis]|uniref:Glycerophosphodiester phosphodiesterase family protein n=1 Tax=Gracilibacillus xinjiangensis TaxID=1193282 RepID=A0ABV8WQZ6_9BACI